MTAPLDRPADRAPQIDAPAVPEHLPPAVLSTRFDGVRFIGEGAFGVVYLARHRETQEEVAVKTIAVGRADLIYRLKHEFRALADLRHRNLIRFYELFADKSPPFFTMEYVPGTDFLSHVRPGGVFDESRLRSALAQLVQGLAELHANGLLHRDVKPSNVRVAPDDRVVLLDFGLAKDLDKNALGNSIELAGTPGYMSPEQAIGDSVSAASDWYSVGAMLYEALTGRVPFTGTWREIIAQRQRADPVAPRALVPEAPADLSDLCLSLITRDPAARAGAEAIEVVLGQASSPKTQVDVPGDRPLVGRQRELDELRNALAQVRDGEGVTVLLDGSSGVGKTSLVERFLGRAERESGALVLRGRCYERERVPYQGIDSLIDDLCRLLNAPERVASEYLPRQVAALVRLFPVMERVPAIRAHGLRTRAAILDEQEIRRQAFGALRELLQRVADRQLLILHIDDLQWGDLDTAKLLRELLRPPDAPPMLLVLGFRSEDRDRSACLMGLLGEPLGPSIELHLRPLDANAAGTLMRALLPGPMQDIDVASLTAGTDGNPFLIQELARAVADPESRLTLNSSPDVHQALRARFARLPPAARRLLETVAVAGHPVTELVARRASGLSGSPWEDSLLLGEQHLVRFAGATDERRLEPFHDRIREAVLADLSPERARECERGLAHAL
ncbi:MAG TPA: protein kinase, partial [Myxococcaceae bacterium]|nr:protein kinase [Myxococcaceae bacterium]